MTTFQFDVPEDDAAAVEQWARRLHVDRSEFLRDAVRRRLVALGGGPYDDRAALAEAADWGPDEDWRDWVDAAR